MAITVFPAPSGGASKAEKTVIIKSTQAWTAPADVTSVEVTLCGGGGSGGAGSSNNSDGGGGSLYKEILTVTPGTSYTVTIGAGGAAVSSAYSYVNGNNGANSSFGALLTATGGGGGQSSQSNSGSTRKGGQGYGQGGDGGFAYYDGSATQVGRAMPGDVTLNLGHGGGPSNTQPYWNTSYSTSIWQLPISPIASAGGYYYPNNPTEPRKNALANSGSGGAGVNSGYGTSTPGGAGGSGVCIIKYWSAL